MKKVLLALVAGLAVSACADDYWGYDSDYYYGDRAYYDGAYGPYYRGYWGGDGSFYYSPGRGRPYLRDHGRHFRRDYADGYRSVRPYYAPRGYRWRDRDHDRWNDRSDRRGNRP